jgi:hypothetical protein
MLKLSGWPRLTWGRVARAARRPPARGPCRGPRARGAGGAASGVHGKSGFRPPLVAPCLRGRPALQPAALLRRGESPGGPVSASARGAARGATRGVTPRQACPRPGGLGRNLRSKTRWFAGFCNSHQVSHFATFFIDARAEISVAESRFG